jgi:truncated hemoglobin YjbI
MRISMSMAVVLMLWLPATAADGDANAGLDRQVFDVLKELNNRGADLNNSGDPIGGYRMYQGGLVVLKIMLGHRPPAQKLIDDALTSAERKPLAERAFALHTTITELRAIFKPAMAAVKPTMRPPSTDAPPLSFPTESKVPPPNNDPPKPAPAPPTNPPPTSSPAPVAPAPALPVTLWDRLGGETKIESAVDDWVTQSLADPKVDLTKGGTQKLEGESLSTCKRRLVGYVSTLSEGTVPYVGKSITDAHPGIPTQGEAFTALLGHLKTALNKNGATAVDADALAKKIEEAK